MSNIEKQSPQLSDKANELARKFDKNWDAFTKMVALHPKTGIAISFAAGFIVAWVF